MQRTLSPLGLILLLLSGGCGAAESGHTIGDDDAGFLESDFFCALPDLADCDRYRDTGSSEGTPSDAGVPTIGDAAAGGDASVATGDASIPADDAGIATEDAGADGMTGLADPCMSMCTTPIPSAPTCGDGELAVVECRVAYFGYCAWHFVCAP